GAGGDEGVVEALFEDVWAGGRDALASAGVASEAGGQLLVRRVIARGGRTRAYVNGALGSLALLRDLAPLLLHVYGQDEHQALRRVESHRDLLDAAGGLGVDVAEMRARWSDCATARQALEERQASQRSARDRMDLLRFQLDELEKAAPVAGEDAQLAGERARLVHAERLGSLVGGAESRIYSGETSAVGTLGRALAALRAAERLGARPGAARALGAQ